MIKLTAKVTPKFYAGTTAGRAATTNHWNNVVAQTLSVAAANVHVDWVPIVEVKSPEPIDLLVECEYEDVKDTPVFHLSILEDRLREPVMGGHAVHVFCTPVSRPLTAT